VAAIEELTFRARAAGTISPAIMPADVLALIWAMRGLVAAGEFAPDGWHRFLDIHLLGMRAGESPSGAPSMSSRQPPR
jgi:hypothetical protein